MQTPEEFAEDLASGVWDRDTLYVGVRRKWLSNARQDIAARAALSRTEGGEVGR